MSEIEVAHGADPAALAGFDAIIDARSPGEFALDHLPGAVNLPVLSDAERAEVGTIYVQESRFRARRIGAAYVARNVAEHLVTALADKPGSFRPLVYCWRGGMRSNAMATILAQVGWRTAVLAGGYQAYRRNVVAKLYQGEARLCPVLLSGPTGAGKTELLARLSALGVQTLDLEALAAHRGSVFGATPGRPQPAQKLFESQLLAELERLDPARPVVIEAESSKIGDLLIPPALWTVMGRAPRIELEASLEARARHIAQGYRELVEDPTGFEALLHRLPGRPGRSRLEDWRSMLRRDDLEQLAAALIEEHYDPAYRRSSRSDTRPLLARVGLAAIAPDSLAGAAEQIVRILAGMDCDARGAAAIGRQADNTQRLT